MKRAQWKSIVLHLDIKHRQFKKKGEKLNMDIAFPRHLRVLVQPTHSFYDASIRSLLTIKRSPSLLLKFRR